MRDCSWLLEAREDFPNVRLGSFCCASDRTRDRDDKYNCIAWAVGKKDTFWWPQKLAGYYWPNGLPREPLNRETVENFLRAFETEGFQRCEHAEFESGFEKVALYVNHLEVPKHAARSLPNGGWTSKLGDDEDIEHPTLGVLEGHAYGRAKYFLKRPCPGRPNEPAKQPPPPPAEGPVPPITPIPPPLKSQV